MKMSKELKLAILASAGTLAVVMVLTAIDWVHSGEVNYGYLLLACWMLAFIYLMRTATTRRH